MGWNLFHTHSRQCTSTYHPTRCSTRPFSHWNEDDCKDRGATAPANTRFKCVHSSWWGRQIPVGMYIHENKSIMFVITKNDTIRKPKWWKLLPVGDYTHKNKTMGITITPLDKFRRPARKVTRRPARKPKKKIKRRSR